MAILARASMTASKFNTANRMFCKEHYNPVNGNKIVSKALQMFQSAHFEETIESTTEVHDRVARRMNILAYSILEGLKTLGPKTTVYNRLLFNYFSMVEFADLYGERMQERGTDKAKLRMKFQKIQTELRAEVDNFCRIPLGVT